MLVLHPEVEIHKDLQKGKSLLKKSVACITAYCYNLLSLEFPLKASTFEAFARLLDTLSSSKDVRAILSLKTASSRSSMSCQQLNISVWKVEAVISSTTLMESVHAPHTLNESLIEGWDFVEHPNFQPPP